MGFYGFCQELSSTYHNEESASFTSVARAEDPLAPGVVDMMPGFGLRMKFAAWELEHSESRVSLTL